MSKIPNLGEKIKFRFFGKIAKKFKIVAKALLRLGPGSTHASISCGLYSTIDLTSGAGAQAHTISARQSALKAM